MRQCPNCGERVEDIDRYCFECGRPLGSGDDTAGQVAQEGLQSPPQGQPKEDEFVPDPEEWNDPASLAPAKSRNRVDSLGTLWVAALATVTALLESASAIVFAEEYASQVAEFDFGTEITETAVLAQGIGGVIIALATAALCVYYYQQGVLDRRFFWGLLVAGVLGFLFGTAISFIVIFGIGAYGLLVVMRRQPQQPRQRGPA